MKTEFYHSPKITKNYLISFSTVYTIFMIIFIYYTMIATPLTLEWYIAATISWLVGAYAAYETKRSYGSKATWNQLWILAMLYITIILALSIEYGLKYLLFDPYLAPAHWTYSLLVGYFSLLRLAWKFAHYKINSRRSIS